MPVRPSDRASAPGHVGERMTVRGQSERHPLQPTDEIERGEVRLERVGFAHAGNVRHAGEFAHHVDADRPALGCWVARLIHAFDQRVRNNGAE